MTSLDELENNFSDMGIEVAVPVLEKCLELCSVYSVGAEELVEEWVSFCITHLNGATGKPTTENIAQLERLVLAKKEVKPETPKSKPLTVYNNANTSSHMNDDAVLSLYNVTPKATLEEYDESIKATRKEHDDESTHYSGKHNNSRGALEELPLLETSEVHSRPCQKRINVTPTLTADDVASHRSPNTFSPATYSLTVITPNGSFKDRTNRNQVLCSHGKELKSLPRAGPLNVSVEPYGPVIPPNSKYMYRQLSDDADILFDTTTAIGSYIIKKYALADPKTLTTASEVDFICIGRVCCDGNGRLNESSVLLEGCRWDMNTSSMPLRLPPGVEYSLFPGQVIVVEGKNPSRNCLIATKIYSDASVNLPSGLPSFQSSGPLQMVVASGPFTFNDSMLYEPLEDLLLYVEKLEPHVFILIGPIVDAEHPLFTENVSFLATPFSEYYEQIMNKLSERFRGKRTKIVVVSSMRDACSHPVYPTPPTLSHGAAQAFSDPCLLNISGLIVGATSTDVLMHLSKEEIAGQSKTDRMTRLVSHLFNQQSFYPLYPAFEEVNLDLSLWEDYAQLTEIPHILLLPSKLRYFIKFVNGCLVINSEYLAKGLSGGSFVQITVEPSSDKSWSPEKNISAQIMKV